MGKGGPVGERDMIVWACAVAQTARSVVDVGRSCPSRPARASTAGAAVCRRVFSCDEKYVLPRPKAKRSTNSQQHPSKLLRSIKDKVSKDETFVK